MTKAVPNLLRPQPRVKEFLRQRSASLRSRLPIKDAYERSLVRYITSAYNILLLREPDPEGLEHFLELLASGKISRRQFLETLRGSEEFRFNVRFTDLLNSLHLSRCDFVQGLPRARRILDLGGTHQSNPNGAFVCLGYPYDFERLVIVDLPVEQRHELYQESEVVEKVQTPRGPVTYRYHSMTDFSGFEEGEFQLVYCGQSIEHITEREAGAVFKGVLRVLEPGGYFCLDTPNARICRLQQPELINPDHKVEYTHARISRKLEKDGFHILEAKGLNYAGRSASEGRFQMSETAANQGLFHEIEDCYLLAYVCQKPTARQPKIGRAHV